MKKPEQQKRAAMIGRKPAITKKRAQEEVAMQKPDRKPVSKVRNVTPSHLRKPIIRKKSDFAITEGKSVVISTEAWNALDEQAKRFDVPLRQILTELVLRHKITVKMVASAMASEKREQNGRGGEEQK